MSSQRPFFRRSSLLCAAADDCRVRAPSLQRAPNSVENVTQQPCAGDSCKNVIIEGLSFSRHANFQPVLREEGVKDDSESVLRCCSLHRSSNALRGGRHRRLNMTHGVGTLCTRAAETHGYTSWRTGATQSTQYPGGSGPSWKLAWLTLLQPCWPNVANSSPRCTGFPFGDHTKFCVRIYINKNKRTWKTAPCRCLLTRSNGNSQNWSMGRRHGCSGQT